MSKIRYNQKNLTLFCFLFRVKQPEVDMPGPGRDRCVPELMLHGTVLITNFSVLHCADIFAHV